MPKRVKISGTGCALVDDLYNNIDFQSENLKKYLSQKDGDGGLSPGKLVFTEEFEAFCGKNFNAVVKDITNNRPTESKNIGGPSIVSLIHAAQMLSGKNIDVYFTGAKGNDDNGKFIEQKLKNLPLKLHNYKTGNKPTPFTDVFSDPNFNNGQGERCFVNNIGAAWELEPEDLNDDFFESDIVVFGGTAIVPAIHDNLTSLLKKAKSKNSLTVVNTVFDFRNEKKNPGQRWPLGSSDETYQYIDLLIVDHEEALRLSGTNNLDTSIRFFMDVQLKSIIITNGANPVTLFSKDHRIKQQDVTTLAASEYVINKLQSDSKIKGDTTGCGDNFVGGVLAYLGLCQLNNEKPDLKDAVKWGIASGGFACFYMGGTWFEKQEGEKKEQVLKILEEYKNQV